MAGLQAGSQVVMCARLRAGITKRPKPELHLANDLSAIIPDVKASTLIPIIREKVLLDSMVLHTDSLQVQDVVECLSFIIGV
jgi:hypothetical protein